MLSARLAPLAGGGVALNVADRWVAVIESGNPAVHQPPNWLKGSSKANLQLVAGGSAYALFGEGEIEVYARDGAYCGKVSVTEANGRSFAGRLKIGMDGSLVTLSDADPCAVSWWPALFGETPNQP